MAIKYDIKTGIITWEKLDFELNVVELLGITLEEFLERSEIDRNFTLHGAKQKTNDNTAGLTNAKGYKDDDRIGAIQEVVDHLANKLWNKTKEGSKGKTVTLPNFIKGSLETGTPVESIVMTAKVIFPLIPQNEVDRLIELYSKKPESE